MNHLLTSYVASWLSWRAFAIQTLLSDVFGWQSTFLRQCAKAAGEAARVGQWMERTHPYLKSQDGCGAPTQVQEVHI